LQPAAIDTGLEYLITPAFHDAKGNLRPRFNTLSVSQQIALILAVRGSPLKFPVAFAGVIQQLVKGGEREQKTSSLPIIRALVGTEMPPLCPEFLYTKTPSFPWGPELCNPEEAHERRKNAAAEHRAALAAAAAITTQTEAMDIHDINKAKITDTDAKLIEAQACIRAELTSTTTTTTTALSPSCVAALDIVFNAAAALGISQSQPVFSSSSTADPLEGAGLRNQLPDDLVLLILTATISPLSSFSKCTTVARTILLPAAVALNAPPTQSLTAAAQHLGKSNPKALIEHCWIPFLSQTTTTAMDSSIGSLFLNRNHAEFILRSIKQGAVPSDLLYILVDALVQIVQYWNDQALAVLQTVLDVRPAVLLPTAPTVTSLAAALLHAGNSSNFTGSIKLAKVLLTFVKRYGKQLQASSQVEALEQCRRAAQSIGTFMMKSTVAALDIHLIK
jgi:hypothetical protein